MYHSSPAYVRGAAPARRCFQSETIIHELRDTDSFILSGHEWAETAWYKTFLTMCDMYNYDKNLINSAYSISNISNKTTPRV